MTTAPRSLPLVALVLLGALVVVHVRLVAGGQTWDDVRYHSVVAPPRLAAADAVLAGTLPGWWEGSGLGVPLVAEPSHGALYPGHWIAASPFALDLVAIAHLAWAAIGIALWARRRRSGHSHSRSDLAVAASEPAAVVAGLLVATSGVVTSLAIRGALPALAHLPWIGLCATLLADACRADEPRDATTAATFAERARPAIGLALLLGAIALTGVFAIVVDAIVLACVLAARKRALPWLVGAIVLGLAIGAAQWWPAVLALGDFAGAPDLRAIPLSRLVELIVPGSFGSTDPARGVEAIAGTSAWAPSLFVGAPLLALAAVRSPPIRIVVLVVGYAALALGVGRVGAWPAILGAPELHVAALAILLAPRAANGLDALIAGERRAIISLGVGAACAGVALGAVLAQRTRHPDAATAIDRALVDGGLGLVCMIAALVLAWRAKAADAASPRRGTLALILGLVALPTVGALPSTGPTVDRSLVEDPPAFAAATARIAHDAPLRAFRPEYMFAFDDSLDAGARPTNTPVLRTVEDQRRPTAETLVDAIATFAGASAWRWDIAAARSEDPARLPEHDRFWLAAAREGGALLHRFGIALAILPETLIVPRKLTSLAQRAKWHLVELPVAPAAAVLHGALWVIDPDDAMALMYPGGGGMGVLPGTVVLRGRGDRRTDRGDPRPCKIDRWDAGVIDLSCTADAPAFATISSSAFAGWQVTVDGESQPWLVADVLRRAVEIPAGTHRVEWRYATPGFATGAIAAIVALLGIVALAITARRPRPKSTETMPSPTSTKSPPKSQRDDESRQREERDERDGDRP